jgi:hypothetical protein
MSYIKTELCRIQSASKTARFDSWTIDNLLSNCQTGPFQGHFVSGIMPTKATKPHTWDRLKGLDS